MIELQKMLKMMSTKDLIDHWRAAVTVAFSSPADDPTIHLYWNVLDQVTAELNRRRLARQESKGDKVSERRPDYEIQVNQEGQKRTDLQKDREIVERCLELIHKRLTQDADTQSVEDISDLAQALFSLTETLAMIETVEAGRPLTLTW